jgi:DNA polymerase III epsilon subunit family exonuclease
MHIEFLSDEAYELSDLEFRGLFNQRYVIFDVEATGPDPVTDCVTQIGAVTFEFPQLCPSASFTQLVKPWKAIPEKIGALTGVTDERVHDAPDFAQVWGEFSRFCSNAVLVTQCGYEFDYPLLDAECDRANLPWLSAQRLDTKAIFALLHPEISETFSTNFLTDYYGIDRSQFQRHDALGDAGLIARIFGAELEEARRLGVSSLKAERIRIRRFILPPL